MKKLFTKKRTVVLAAVPVIACAILWVAKRSAKKGAEPWCASFLTLLEADIPLGAETDILWRERPRVDPPAIRPPFDVRPNV